MHWLNLFAKFSVTERTADYFLAVNGVKQGGVLSPIVFSVYIDGLLVRLTNSNVGCYVGSFFVGALAYADDIVLLAPTPSAMHAQNVTVV